MNIADSILYRPHQNAIHQFDDGRVRGGKLLKGDLFGRTALDFKIFGRIRHQGTKVVHLGDGFFLALGFEFKKGLIFVVADLVVFFVGIDNILGRGDADIQVLLDDVLQLLDIQGIGRLGHGDLQGITGQSQRKGHEPLGGFIGDEL